MRKTHKEQALEWLKTGKPLSSFEAFEHHHNTRLSASIFLLRNEGYNIDCKPVKNKQGKIYYEYRLCD